MTRQLGYSTVEWSREMNLKLIEELRKRKSLWDRRSSEYQDKNKRKMDYQELADAFVSPCSEMKKKIHNLKSQFRREYKKSKADTITNYKSQWYGFTLLKFLKESDEENVFKNPLKSGIRNHKKKINMEIDVPSSTVPTSPSKRSECIERELDDRDMFMNSKNSFYSTKVNGNSYKPDRDEYTIFGEYVTYELRKIENPYIMAITKHKIQECLFEAQMSIFSSISDYNDSNMPVVPYVNLNLDECMSSSNMPSSTSLEKTT